MGLVLYATWEGTISGCPCGISNFGTLELDYSFLRKTSWQHFSDNHRDSKFLSSLAHRLSFHPFDLHQKMRCQPQHPVDSCHKPSSCPGTMAFPSFENRVWCSHTEVYFSQSQETKQCSGFKVTKNHVSVRHRMPRYTQPNVKAFLDCEWRFRNSGGSTAPPTSCWTIAMIKMKQYNNSCLQSISVQET